MPLLRSLATRTRPDTRPWLHLSYTFLQKLANVGCSRGVEAKFDEVGSTLLLEPPRGSVHAPDTRPHGTRTHTQAQTELDVLTSHLWSLSGAGGGARAPPLTRRRLRRGSWTLLRGLAPGEADLPLALCVARRDAHTCEAWWPHHGQLIAVDLALLSRRTLPSAHAGCVSFAPDVTAVAADPSARHVWTGHSDGSVACWAVQSGLARGSRVACLPPACGPVAHLVLASRGTVWCGGAKGSLLRVVTMRSQASRAVRRDGSGDHLSVLATSSGPPSVNGVEEDGGAETEPETLLVLADGPSWTSPDAAQDAAGHGKASVRVAALVSSPGDDMRAATWVWGAKAGEAALCAWDAHSGALATRWSCASMGPVAALAAWPQQYSTAKSGGRSLGRSGSSLMDDTNPPALVSTHKAGGVHVWAALGAPLRRLAAAAPGLAPCSLVLCCGLACVAHGDGVIRMWPLTSGGPPLAAGTLRAHRSGMRGACLVEGDALGGGDMDTDGGLITSGRSGSVALWPASELIAAVATEPAAAAAVAAWRAARSTTPRAGGGRRTSVRLHPGDANTLTSRPSGVPPNLSIPASGQAGSAQPSPVGLPHLNGAGSLPATPRDGPAALPQTPGSQRSLGARIIPFSEVTLKGPVGEGSYGTVYQGTWMATEVAVKMWRLTDGTAGAVAEGLVAEVALMQELRHPNIVMLLGVTTEPPGIVQEYCSRGSLYGVLRRHASPGAPPLAWRVRLQMALGAATGMCYLHGCRPVVLHRDLKSPNLLVDRHWRVKVGDFGLSRVTLSSVAVASVPGIHSPRWMAPEVLVEGKHSKASDVFSFAVVLWELATLQVPWDGANQWQVMHAVADEKVRCPLPDTPSPAFPTGWPSYCALMARAWAHDPAERPSFTVIVGDLQAILDALMAAERPANRVSGAPQSAASTASQGQGGSGDGGTAGQSRATAPPPPDPVPQAEAAATTSPREGSPRKRSLDWTQEFVAELRQPPPRMPVVKSNTMPLRLSREGATAEVVQSPVGRRESPPQRGQHAGWGISEAEDSFVTDAPPPPPPPVGVAAKAVAARTAAKARRAAAAQADEA